MKQLVAVIVLSAGFGVFADSTFNWTCNFGDDYEAEVAKYVSLNTKATATKVTGSNTQKNGETYLVLSDAETKTVSDGITSTINFPYEVKLANGVYTMEFDYAPTYNGSNDKEATVYGLAVYGSNGNALFNLYGKKYNGGIDICMGAGTSDVLASIDTSSLTQYNIAQDKANWLHVTITGDEGGNKVTLNITELSDGSSVFKLPVVPPVVVTNSYVTLGKLTVKTASFMERHQWAGLDNLSFSGTLPTGITEWTSGTVTESIVFGAALETAEAVSISNVGTQLNPIIFMASNDSPDYGLSQTATGNWMVTNAYFAIASGAYAIKDNIQLGSGGGASANRSPGNFTMEGGSLKLDGAILHYGGQVNINGGSIVQAGTMQVGATSRSEDAVFNQNGGSIASSAVRMGQYAQSSTLNLNGGVFTTGGFSRNSDYSASINLNGGTLAASRDNSAFIPSEGFSVKVDASGGTIDTASHNITIHAPITGEGKLTVKGGGKLTLSAAYGGTGALTVESGTTLGTTLDLGGQTDTFASATIGGTVTNGTLVVTGKATFTSGAVIDVGNLALADGVVVLECGSVDGLENLTVKANGMTVNYKLKYEASQGGIVLRRKGLVILVK